jgi:cytochrome c553
MGFHKEQYMFDFVGVLALVMLGALFGWLALRARRAQRPVLKWGGLAVSGLLSLVFTLALLVALVGFYKLNVPPYHNAVADIKVARTPAEVARGERFAFVCAGCHSPHETPPLAGQVFPQGGGLSFGTLAVPNLTPAGEIKDWSDGEIIRAIREGVHKSGRPLVIMPSEAFHSMSDADVQSIVAYLRSQPAVEPNTPAMKLNVLAAVFVGAGMFTTSAQTPITQPIVAPVAGATSDYGEYLVSTMNCRGCHGEHLTGGKPGQDFAGPNLAVIVPTWSETGFVATLRTGADPAGHTLGEGMPRKEISAFASDDDLRAIYAYLRSLARVAPPPQ